MPSVIRRSQIAIATLALFAAGCQNSSPGLLPAGPGVATRADLTPWLASAKEAKRFGCLMEFNVPGQLGSYDTWGLAAAIPSQSVEIDIRACPNAAQIYNQKLVIITGKLIARDERHLPLLVAEQIVPADDDGNQLPDSAHHIVMSPEPDPITGQFGPLIDFHASDDIAPVASAGN